MEEEAELLITLKTLLEEKQCFEVLQIWGDEKNKETIKNVGWELVGVLCELLNTHNKEVAATCKTLLYDMEKICQGKEILLGLNEQLAKECTKETLSVLTELCKNVFQRLPRKQSFYLSDILEGLLLQLKLNKQKFCDSDSNHTEKDFKECQYHVFQFVSEVQNRIQLHRFSDLESYLQETSIAAKGWHEYELMKCRNHLLTFFLDFLEVVSDFIPETSNTKTDKSFVVIAVGGILSLKRFSEFISSASDHATQSKAVGLLIFFYLAFVEERHLEEIPCIYSKHILYTMVTQPIVNSLGRSSKQICRMALELHSYFMQRMENESMRNHTNEQEKSVNIALGFANLMIWSDDEKIRTQAKQQFDVLLQKWKPVERFEIMRFLYIKSDHAGLQGYLIDSINLTLKKDFQNEKFTCISICDMKELIELFTTMEVGRHHILQESERLMAGLNFIRFWLLRDLKPKKTAMWNCLDIIKDKIACIRCAIEVTVAEYNKFLMSESNEKHADIDFELAIPGGDMMKGMPHEEKRKMAELALVTLDMMKNVISRLNEIIEQSVITSK